MSARRDLDQRLLSWTREARAAAASAADAGGFARDEARFEELALSLFRFQFEHCAAYRRYCEGRGRTPADVACADDVPAVPAAAFKELRLACFAPHETRHVFRTSGTSRSGRGRLELDDLAPYEASLLPSFEHFLLPATPAAAPDARVAATSRVRLLVLTPAPEEAPDSSLSHMFGVALRERGDAGSAFLVRGAALDVDATLRALEAASQLPTLLLCGTAFAFVHLLEALAQRDLRLALPAGTRIMETGGFKGRARERPADVLYAEIEAALGVPAARIVNQYGMTELASQFYDSVLVDPTGPRRKLGPPWARVRLVDPDSGAPVAPGEPGVIRIHDLANTGSIAAIQTADLGRPVADGFAVLGRAPGAEERGCSIALDEMLAS